MGMKLTNKDIREIREMKDKVGTALEGSNGAMFMCILTSLIADAGVQWRDGTSKNEFIAETVEAISQWYDWYLERYEEDDDE